MARTTPVSKGWMILMRPLSIIFPDADATTSTVPKLAQASARQKTTMIVATIARPIGDGGASTISRAAGRKATSSLLRRSDRGGRRMIFLADFMDSSLDAVKRSITAAATNEFLVRAIFDNSATIQCNNAVNAAHGRKTMGNDEDSAPFGDPVHIFLGDP